MLSVFRYLQRTFRPVHGLCGRAVDAVLIDCAVLQVSSHGAGLMPHAMHNGSISRALIDYAVARGKYERTLAAGKVYVRRRAYGAAYTKAQYIRSCKSNQ